MKFNLLKSVVFLLIISIKSIEINAQVISNPLSESTIASLPTSFNWEPAQSLPVGWKNFGMGAYTTGHDAPNAGKFDTQNDSLIIHYDQTATSLNYYLKGYSLKPPYTFKVLESADGINYSVIQLYSDSINPITTKYVGSTLYPLLDSRYIKFEYTNRKGGNIAIDDVRLIASVSPTDIDEKQEEVKTYVYPNPVYNIVYIQSYTDSFKAIVYDLLGNQIAQRDLGANDSAEINTSSFKSGIYFVTIKNEDQEVKTIKFIKH